MLSKKFKHALLLTERKSRLEIIHRQQVYLAALERIHKEISQFTERLRHRSRLVKKSRPDSELAIDVEKLDVNDLDDLE